MIQRIQSVYLLLAGIAMAVMFFLPLGSFFGDDCYFVFGLRGLSELVCLKEVNVNTIPLFITAAAAGLLSIVSIFLFHDRLLQVKLIRFNILINLAVVIFMYFGYIDPIVKKTATTVEYGSGVYFPLISLVLLFLAMRAVLNDEKKVRAADRLR